MFIIYLIYQIYINVSNIIFLEESFLHVYNIYIYISIYTTSEKPVNDQSYGMLDRYGITILYK